MISRTKEFCPLKSTLLNILTNELGAGEGQSLFIERSSPRLETLKDSLLYSGAPNENIVQNHLNIELLNLF